MRKFIFNTTLLSALFGGWGTVQATRKGPRDWRLALMWISWGLTVAIAVEAASRQRQVHKRRRNRIDLRDPALVQFERANGARRDEVKTASNPRAA